MKYGNIDKKTLKIVLGEDWPNSKYTLKDELDKYGEDIIFARYLIKKNKEGYYFEFFHAWSENYTFTLIQGMLGNEMVLLGLNRNPPKEGKKNE